MPKTDHAGLPEVRLIPVEDPTSLANERREEVQSILAMMYAGLHKRGRPAKIRGTGDGDAA